MRQHVRRSAAALAVVIIAAGAAALSATPAGAAVIQDGPVNYAGPGPCPAGTTDCLIAAGDIDVVQKAPSSGRNTVDCRGSTCKAVQSGSTASATPQNSATCSNATTASASDQRCDISQTGSSNAITADLAATPSSGGVVSLANVLQSNEQRFVTSQNGANNSLTVKATIDQQASSVLNANTPVTHTQTTLLRSQNTMNATSANTADFQLNRTQNSSATGANPTQFQDTSSGAESDGAIAGLGAVRLIAKTPGTNTIKIRGTDTKNQTASSLNNGTATQQQGHSAGGWTIDLSGTDTGVAGSGFDVDLGTPGSGAGITKDWTQTATGLLGGAIVKDQDQIDDIRLPLIGKSPMRVTMDGLNKLTTDEGGHQVCNASSEGHAQLRSVGRLACEMKAGTKVKNPQVTWDAVTWNVDVNCEQNNDICPGGTVTTARKLVKVKIFGATQSTMPVAILTQPNDNNPATVDDATTVNPATVCFGEENEAEASQRDCTEKGNPSLVDVDNDGDIDLKMHFDTPQTGIDNGDTTACLTGTTYSGDGVEGCAPLK